MKKLVATLFYVSFLVLALRVDAASADTAAPIERAESALAKYRATGRDAFVAEAEAAVAGALAQAPNNYVAQRTEVAVLLARHADRTALARISALNRRFPDDLDTYALLIDAELALGMYGEAERDTQRLLDLRPDNVPGLLRAARLRELYGDWQGAIDLVNACFNRSTEDDLAQQASLYAQLARLHFGAGHEELASQALQAALAALPDFPPALKEGARIARLRGDAAQALAFAQHLYRVSPGADELLVLARASAAAGAGARAAPLFRQFVEHARAIAARDDNANLALSSYYAHEGHDNARAVSFAASARAQRADVDTLLAYASALHRAERDSEAQKVVASLDALGYRAAEFMALAGAMHVTLAGAVTVSPELR